MKVEKCSHYQGVCGLDESYVCYCASSYLACKLYKHKEMVDTVNKAMELEENPELLKQKINEDITARLMGKW